MRAACTWHAIPDLTRPTLRIGAADTYLGMRHCALRGNPSQALARDMLARHLVAEGMQTALAPARSRKDETAQPGWLAACRRSLARLLRN